VLQRDQRFGAVTQLEPTARTRCPIPKLTWREGLASDSGKYGSKKRLTVKRVPTQPKETNHEKSMMRRRKVVFFFFLQRLASIIVIIMIMVTLLSVYYRSHRERVRI
jgi:hypothetical protein